MDTAHVGGASYLLFSTFSSGEAGGGVSGFLSLSTAGSLSSNDFLLAALGAVICSSVDWVWRETAMFKHAHLFF